MDIKFFCLICFSIIISSCTTLNISAINKNVKVENQEVSNPRSLESIIETSKESIVLLSTSPFEDPTEDASKNAVCTGAVIDEMGHILTNYHCIHNQKSILLYFHDENDIDEYEVDVIGIDPLADLALLKVINNEKKLPYLTFTKNIKDIKSGMNVFALGHPMGMAWSITKGVISSNERYARHPYIHALQTDAAINKGNSGGPLLNMRGEIIGINTLMVSRISENAGVGLAIRSDVVQSSIDSMIKTGEVIRPAIGIHIMPLGHPTQRKLIIKEYPKIKESNIPNVSGMFVSESSGSDLPEGIKKFDTVIAIDGKPFNHGVEFSNILNDYKVGDQVTLTIIRKRRYFTVDIILGILPVDIDKMYNNTNRAPNQTEKN